MNRTKFKLWRSIDSYHSKTQSNEKKEVTKSFQDLIERGAKANLNRKSFLTIMGASLSMATVQCVREPLEKIVPYVTRPPETIPGVPVHYASAQVTSEVVTPVLLKTREGKPIYVDGNQDHPLSGGGVSSDTHASIWDLYDPDRVKEPQKKSGGTFADATWENAIKTISARLNDSAAVLSRSSFSPSESFLANEIATKFSLRQVVYDPIGNQQEVLTGEKLSYGTEIIPDYRFELADVILSVEADFIGTWLSPEIYSYRFSKRRNPDTGDMNHLMVAESFMTLTGANADSRYAMHAGSQKALLLGLAKILGSTHEKVQDYTLAKVSAETGIKEETITEMAARLKNAAGKSIVIAGGSTGRQGVVGELQIAANLLNSLLGNEGKTIRSQAPMKSSADISSPQELASLIADMNSGKIKTLLIDRANPVFDLPLASQFKEALEKVELVVSIADHMDDTATKSHWVLPVSHYLESWSDAYSYGYYMVVQPVIRELHNSRSAGDIWLLLAGMPGSFYDYIRAQVAPAYLTGNFENSWSKLIAEGYKTVKTDAGGSARSFQNSALAILKDNPKTGDYRLNLYASVLMGDGKGANISFRHEVPDPVSKITWDNFLAVSHADAQANKWKDGNILEISNGEQTLQVPISVQPGLKQGNMALAIGYGHESIGEVGKGIGVNAWKIAPFKEGVYQMGAIDISAKKIKGHHRIVTTQTHHDMAGRHLANFASFEEFKKEPNAGIHDHGLVAGPDGSKGLYKDYDYSQTNRWVLNIDLTKCTGCSSCVMACYSENNIPAVGKREISVGREMAWLRIDRYFYSPDTDDHVSEDLENPAVVFQPVMCQHCENAPCENVCPVGATSHSNEGLNDMAYNRCIGTRYCSDNCPYKVRRFNWFENWKRKIRDPQQFALNPDVTVRSRGVIEKCSMCVQRINEKRQLARLEDREVSESELQVACQQGCSTQAIHFGNANDTTTFVGKNESNPRQYRLLEEINTRPRVQYMTRIVNRV